MKENLQCFPPKEMSEADGVGELGLQFKIFSELGKAQPHFLFYYAD